MTVGLRCDPFKNPEDAASASAMDFSNVHRTACAGRRYRKSDVIVTLQTLDGIADVQRLFYFGNDAPGATVIDAFRLRLASLSGLALRTWL